VPAWGEGPYYKEEPSMPQLRQDTTTKEWVIIATERLRTPHDFKKVEPAEG